MNAVETFIDWSSSPDETWYCDAYKDVAGVTHIVAFGRIIEQPKEESNEQAGSSSA